MERPVEEVIGLVMKEARERAGSSSKLIRKMPEHLRKSQSAISAYIKGDSMPPAEVFLEAARVMGIRIDEYLYGESIVGEVAILRQELDELKRWREGGPQRR